MLAANHPESRSSNVVLQWKHSGRASNCVATTMGLRAWRHKSSWRKCLSPPLKPNFQIHTLRTLHRADVVGKRDLLREVCVQKLKSSNCQRILRDIGISNIHREPRELAQASKSCDQGTAWGRRTAILATMRSSNCSSDLDGGLAWSMPALSLRGALPSPASPCGKRRTNTTIRNRELKSADLHVCQLYECLEGL
jgi:hypothetical protein